MPSDLPIITPPVEPPPRRSTVERFGGLLYLGVGGLVVLMLLLAYFGLGVWNMRGDLARIYRLHDPKEPVARRVQAAYELSESPRVNQRQYWDMALRVSTPPLARYVLAESLTTEAVAADPQGYALAVARSPGWPPWFRWLIARPMAYAQPGRLRLSDELAGQLIAAFQEPHYRLWADFIVVNSGAGDQGLKDKARGELRASSHPQGSTLADLAGQLSAAHDEADTVRRLRRLDRATRWMRLHVPESAAVWDGWTLEEGQLVQSAAP